MSILPAPARPLLALVGAAAALGLAAGPAAATPHKSSKATAAKAKAKTKVKVKKAKAKADLAVRNLQIDVSDEGTLLVSANLFNVGQLFATPSTVVIALSDDTTFDADSDEVLDEIDYTRIGAGVRRQVDDEVDIPLDVDTSEELNLLVCADEDGIVAEKSETNNCASQPVVLDDIVPADDGSDDTSSADDGSDQTDPADDSGQ